MFNVYPRIVFFGVLAAASSLLESDEEAFESQKFLEKGDFFEGDIRFADEIFVRTGIIDLNRRWPNNTVHYEINSTFSKYTCGNIVKSFVKIANGRCDVYAFPASVQRDIIFAGLNEIEANTCIKFVLRSNETDYIHVQELDTGCWSYVGRRSDKQALNLETPGCMSKRIVMHEFIHALGFYHQHSATDRDQFIEILMENVIDNRQHNFNKYSPEIITDFGVGYDYLSVMHYNQYAFSKNGNRTIVTKDPTMQTIIGRVSDLSERDMAKIRAMYNCSDSENAIR